MNKSIYLKPINGLCNRILFINSVFNFAKKYDFNIKISWDVSDGFSDESFESLFDISILPKEIEFINKKDYKKACGKFISLEDYFKQHELNLNYTFFVKKENLFNKLKDNSFCYNGFHTLDWIFNLKETYEFIEKYIKPNKELEEKIKKIEPADNGMHIRRNDIFNFPRKDKYLLSKEKDYERIVQKSKENFFLSTDDFKIKKNFKEKYSEQIYTNELVEESIFQKEKNLLDKKFQMDCKPFQKNAAIDLFCLSKTKKIYGNNWSTFSYVASIIGKNKLEIVSKKTKII